MSSNSALYAERRSQPYPLMWGALAILIAVTAVAAAAGGVASVSAPDFYLSLSRPTWAPPPSVFGPVWSVLYLLMAIAAWIVVRIEGWERARPALVLYGAQLVANAAWTWLFFSMHSGVTAFLDIIVLWLLVTATIVAFGRVHKLAGALLLPYLAWVSFAAALTWAVWQANPGTL